MLVASLLLYLDYVAVIRLDESQPIFFEEQFPFGILHGLRPWVIVVFTWMVPAPSAKSSNRLYERGRTRTPQKIAHASFLPWWFQIHSL